MDGIELLASGFTLAEGPVVDASGALCVADTLAGGIRILRPGGGQRRVLPDRRGIGGMVRHTRGDLVVSGREVVAVDLSGPEVTVRPVLTDPDAAGFNDLGAGPGGELLAGVLRYRPLHGDPPVPGTGTSATSPPVPSCAPAGVPTRSSSRGGRARAARPTGWSSTNRARCSWRSAAAV